MLRPLHTHRPKTPQQSPSLSGQRFGFLRKSGEGKASDTDQSPPPPHESVGDGAAFQPHVRSPGIPLQHGAFPFSELLSQSLSEIVSTAVVRVMPVVRILRHRSRDEEWQEMNSTTTYGHVSTGFLTNTTSQSKDCVYVGLFAQRLLCSTSQSFLRS